MFYEPDSKSFSYSDAFLPLSLDHLFKLEDRGFLIWEREDVRQAVLTSAPLEGNRRRPRMAPRPSWDAFLSRPRRLWLLAALIALLAALAFLLAGILGVSAPSPAAASPVATVTSYLHRVDAAVESRDATGYASLVDLTALSSFMTSQTVSAYDSMTETTPTPEGRAAIRQGFSAYSKDVLDLVRSGKRTGVPLYGLTAATVSSQGSTVSVSLVPQPAQDSSVTTAPRPTGTEVTYVFAVGPAGPRLTDVRGLMPYLKTTALFLSRPGTVAP